uniref:NADH-ubiquinone oxidoreductase chain 2 n=1 Tax=Challia fletcheri TaxID=1091408 RepID=J7F0B2_9NEOP|nr:NADH dehydrogenase subunit 2 [Challia fletcheri]AEP83048.1 NADH dehydrogenase subunit 2 [Challia fletcheri]
MMMNLNKFGFGLLMVLGSLLVLGSSNWFSAWVGLEMNLMAFLPLLVGKDPLSVEGALKYFLVQVVASMILIVSILVFYYWGLNMKFYINMIFFSLSMSLGLAPFHYWFPEVCEGLSWGMMMILLIWQSLGLFGMMIHLPVGGLLDWFIIVGMLVGGLGGLNQGSLRKIMAYSSINHMGWMLCALSMSAQLWFVYYVLYGIVTFFICLLFKLWGLYYLSQIVMLGGVFSGVKLVFYMSFLSLGGLPPFLGFLPSMLIIYYLLTGGYLFLCFMSVLLSLVSLYYYLRVCYVIYSGGSSSMLWVGSCIDLSMKVDVKMNFFMVFLGGVSILGLLILVWSII